MNKYLTKYRVSTRLKKAKSVAAECPQDAVEACFPSHEVNFSCEGYRWSQYKLNPPVPSGWPNEIEDDGKPQGNVVVAEEVGTILVVIGDTDASEKDRTGKEDSESDQA